MNYTVIYSNYMAFLIAYYNDDDDDDHPSIIGGSDHL